MVFAYYKYGSLIPFDLNIILLTWKSYAFIGLWICIVKPSYFQCSCSLKNFGDEINMGESRYHEFHDV